MAVKIDVVQSWDPSPAKVPPSGAEWIHEIKHDGFRLMARAGEAAAPPS